MAAWITQVGLRNHVLGGSLDHPGGSRNHVLSGGLDRPRGRGNLKASFSRRFMKYMKYPVSAKLTRQVAEVMWSLAVSTTETC